jgi:hypothetical protein
VSLEGFSMFLGRGVAVGNRLRRYWNGYGKSVVKVSCAVAMQTRSII